MLLEATTFVVICYAAAKKQYKQIYNSMERLVVRLLWADPKGSSEHHKKRVLTEPTSWRESWVEEVHAHLLNHQLVKEGVLCSGWRAGPDI